MSRTGKYYPYKPSSQMEGPYVLNAANVNALLPTHGVYLLGEFVPTRDGSRIELVEYTGRAMDLTDRLKDWIGKYPIFRYVMLESATAAFRKECAEFHRYDKVWYLDNEIHPARPAGYKGKSCSMDGCSGELE